MLVQNVLHISSELACGQCKAQRNAARNLPPAISWPSGPNWVEKNVGRRSPYDLARHLLIDSTAQNLAMKPVTFPVLRSTRLLDQVRERFCW
jgi:hypothetical protein